MLHGCAVACIPRGLARRSKDLLGAFATNVNTSFPNLAISCIRLP